MLTNYTSVTTSGPASDALLRPASNRFPSRTGRAARQLLLFLSENRPIRPILNAFRAKKDELMLPFLKNQKEGSAAGPAETIKRTPDDGGDVDLLDAVADDMLAAFQAGDKELLKAALASFVDHIQTLDEVQDQSMTGV